MQWTLFRSTYGTPEENHIEGSEDAELGLEPVGFQGIQRHPRVDGKWILGPRGLG